jgi:hypothetical protein
MLNDMHGEVCRQLAFYLLWKRTPVGLVTKRDET